MAELPNSCRAAVLSAYREPVEVREVAVLAPEPGAVVVEVAASTMCGTDPHMADGDYAETGLSRLPLIQGHEIVGRVAAIGTPGQTDSLNRPLEEGDLIAWAYPWCGHCYWCTIAKQPSLCENWQGYGWGPADQKPYLTGGFAEYCYVMPRCKTIKLPDGIDPAVLASATCALRTVVHGFEAAGGVKPDDCVVIQGSGPVGLYALAYAIRGGASRVICLGAPADRLEIAARWGADRTLDIFETTPEERVEAVRELSEGRGADLVVECSGAAAAFEEAFDLIRRGGRYLVIGQADKRASQIHATNINLRQLTVVGTISADISHYRRAVTFIADNADRFDFESLLGRRYRLDQVNDALDAMREAREPKPVIEPAAA